MFDRRYAMLALTALVLAPASLAGQDWRTVTSSRSYGGEEKLDVKIEYGAGEFSVDPGAAGVLYRSMLRYNADSFRPVATYEKGRLTLGIRGGEGISSLKSNGKARLDVTLGQDAPIDLDMDFGAVEAKLELGGLRLHSLELSTGASETNLSFSRPNRDAMRMMKLEAGAAEFNVVGLGNANAERFDFDGGIGDIRLDFTGEWRRDMKATVDMGVGSLTLVLPRGLGVRVRKDTFLTSFDSEGLIKRGGSYYSENWESAEHKLTLSVNAALGSITVRWVDGVASR